MFIGIEASHANKPQKTGVENYCWHIIQGLKKQIPSSERVVLYSNTPLAGELAVLPPNWEVKILRWPFRKLWSQIRLSLELLIHPPDVFFAPGQLIPFFCPAKIVATMHDCAFLAFPQAYNFWGRQYLKWMNKLIIKRADLIITPSEFSKNEILRFYSIAAKFRFGGNNINEGRIEVIPEAYDADVFKVGSGSPSSAAPQEGESYVLKRSSVTRPFIMSVGRLEEKKNTLGIIKAFNILKKEPSNNPLKLLLVGQPRVGYEKIKREINLSPYKADIITPGWVSEADVASLLSMAAVFVFPSFYEGFGLPVLEAMACGCPAVLSEGVSLSEVGGDAALYTDPADVSAMASAVSKLLSDHNLRAEKIKAGLARARLFSWEIAAQKTWSLLADCLSKVE